jgi:hypothetical protein
MSLNEEKSTRGNSARKGRKLIKDAILERIEVISSSEIASGMAEGREDFDESLVVPSGLGNKVSAIAEKVAQRLGNVDFLSQQMSEEQVFSALDIDELTSLDDSEDVLARIRLLENAMRSNDAFIASLERHLVEHVVIGEHLRRMLEEDKRNLFEKINISPSFMGDFGIKLRALGVLKRDLKRLSGDNILRIAAIIKGCDVDKIAKPSEDFADRKITDPLTERFSGRKDSGQETGSDALIDQPDLTPEGDLDDDDLKDFGRDNGASTESLNPIEMSPNSPLSEPNIPLHSIVGQEPVGSGDRGADEAVSIAGETGYQNTGSQGTSGDSPLGNVAGDDTSAGKSLSGETGVVSLKSGEDGGLSEVEKSVPTPLRNASDESSLDDVSSGVGGSEAVTIVPENSGGMMDLSLLSSSGEVALVPASEGAGDSENPVDGQDSEKPSVEKKWVIPMTQWGVLDLEDIGYAVEEITASNFEEMEALKMKLPPKNLLRDTLAEVEDNEKEIFNRILKDQEVAAVSVWFRYFSKRKNLSKFTENEMRAWMLLSLEVGSKLPKSLGKGGWYDGVLIPKEPGSTRLYKIVAKDRSFLGKSMNHFHV